MIIRKVDVCEAKDGMVLEKGHAYLAPGNMHLTMKNMEMNIKQDC